MQRDAGSSRELQSRSTMSQHVPMSPRARTAADIIIVYSIRPWESGRHCASPPLACSEQFLGEAVCSAASVRGTRVLSAAGVSSLRSDSVDSATLCVRTLLGATPIAQRFQNASTPDDRASSNEDFGELRASAKRERSAPPHRRTRFSGLNVVYDAKGNEYPIDEDGNIVLEFIEEEDATVSQQNQQNQGN